MQFPGYNADLSLFSAANDYSGMAAYSEALGAEVWSRNSSAGAAAVRAAA